MNKGECGELLALALACCDFSIAHATGSSAKSVVALGKGLDKKTIRLLVKDKDGCVYIDNYPRSQDKKKRIILPTPRIRPTATSVTLPTVAKFRPLVVEAIRAVAKDKSGNKKNFLTDPSVDAVLKQLQQLGFKLSAANASSKEDIYLGFRRDARVRGISIKTHGLAGDAALLNASEQTRCLWCVEAPVDIPNFPFPFVKDPAGGAIIARDKSGKARWINKNRKIPRYETGAGWLRESIRALNQHGSFRLILPTDDAMVATAPMQVRLREGGRDFVAQLGSEQARLLAAVSLLRYTIVSLKTGPNLEDVVESIYDNVKKAWFVSAIGMKMPDKGTAMAHLTKALLSFSRGLTPKSAKSWRSESAVGGIAYLVFDDRDDAVYLRYFDPSQDEKEVIDFTVDHASPDTPSTFRHHVGFVLDQKGRRIAEDSRSVPIKFYNNNDILPCGTYYLHTNMAYRHRPDVSLFKEEYLNHWRAQHRRAEERLASALGGD